MQQSEYSPLVRAHVQVREKVRGWVLLPPLLQALRSLRLPPLLAAVQVTRQLLVIQMQAAVVERNHKYCHWKFACLG